jgi:hypothetical protein
MDRYLHDLTTLAISPRAANKPRARRRPAARTRDAQQARCTRRPRRGQWHPATHAARRMTLIGPAFMPPREASREPTAMSLGGCSP